MDNTITEGELVIVRSERDLLRDALRALATAVAEEYNPSRALKRLAREALHGDLASRHAHAALDQAWWREFHQTIGAHRDD